MSRHSLDATPSAEVSGDLQDDESSPPSGVRHHVFCRQDYQRLSRYAHDELPAVGSTNSGRSAAVQYAWLSKARAGESESGVQVRQSYYMRTKISLVVVLGCLGFLSVASSALAEQQFTLDGTAGGKRFDGIGAVSGGGATSVLLKDYPEPQRSEILDLLFKPNFGASMSALFVEIPGDGNSTQGSELSHMHSRGDENYSRGYEWWLMREAKKRNAAITLDGVAWGSPGWVGNGDFASQDMCDYYAKWIRGLKNVYGLDLDAIGCRNERGVYTDFAKRLRRTLNTNGLQSVKLHAFDNWGKGKWDWCSDLEKDPELRSAVDILGNHTMSEVPTPEHVKQLAAKYNKPIWNTEEHVYKQGFDCEISLVQVFNENYISNAVTKVVCWYLISAFYPVEPYHNVTMMVADSPWSGHYSVNLALWAYAHYCQFSKVGWNYLNGACTNLSDGGSFVTLTSGSDFSIVAETKGAKATQPVRFKIAGGLATGKLCVWRSNAKEQFVRLNDIVPDKGEFAIALEPDSIYSISTTTGQQKGGFESIPVAKAFPFPYRDTFDQYTNPEWWGYQPRYTADICGGFEIAPRPDGKGKCLRQVIDQMAQNWGPEWMPYTIIGDRNWKDYEVSAEIQLDNGGWAGVMGRISGTGSGWGCNPKGYYARLEEDGAVSLYVSDSSKNGAPGKQLAAAKLSEFASANWYNLKLRFVGAKITVLIDGAEVLSTNDSTYASGMVGLVTGGENNARNTACFDDLAINAVGEEKPASTQLTQRVNPMYKPGSDLALSSKVTTRESAPGPLVTSAASASSGLANDSARAAALAAKYLARFTSGSMAAKQSWDLASASINAGDFAAALSTLQDLRTHAELTPDQSRAIDETISAIQDSAKAE
jgi:galactosylceramidase